MIHAINNYYNKPTDGNPKGRTFFSIFSAVFILIFLYVDSVPFSQKYFDGRNLVNIIVIIYFFLMLHTANSKLRRLMLVMVPMSYLGEITFCNILDMYDYRENRIPLYVPFGHAIVYGSGYMFSLNSWAIKNDAITKKTFIGFFILIFTIAGLFFFDILSIILGCLFFYALRRKGWNNLYFYVAVYVLIVEFTGTYFGVWVWEKYTLGFLPTLNPPVGAVFLYIGGDAVLLKLMRFFDKKELLRPIDFERPKEIW